MRSLTQFQIDTARFCNVSTTDTQAISILDTYINDSIKTVCNIQGGKLRFLEDTVDINTVADKQCYQTPNKFRKIIDMYVTIGADANSTIYMPGMVFDPTKWKRILAAKLGTSDQPFFTYVESQKFCIQPIPASSTNVITIRGRKRVIDLTMSDYTAGTIESIANDGTTVTGSGTTWTADMVGRYIRIDKTQAANGGDGYWYEIAGYTSATVITLLKPYEGTAIAVGSAVYTIGEMSPIPEAYDIAPVYRAAALYWENQTDERAKKYWLMYDGGNEAGYSKEYGGIISQMLANEGETEEGSYLPPFGSTGTTMNAPYWYPFQDSSGFN